VLVVDSTDANDAVRIAEFEKDTAKFNSLRRRGYSAAKPYFNLLHMTNGQVYFVFGFRGEVQGVHRRNYPATVKNLRRLKHNGKQKYSDMHWVPVAEIRRLLTAP
jgi:calcineurin-like phosphoesterase family protein